VPCLGDILIVLLVDDEQDGAGLLAGRERMRLSATSPEGSFDVSVSKLSIEQVNIAIWVLLDTLKFNSVSLFREPEDVRE
jgi:hypothetical protein